MGARSTWTGTIGFGLVQIPVKLYSAVESEARSGMSRLHAACGTHLQQQQFCPTCNKTVTKEDYAKGYEIDEGKYVRIEDSDIKGLGLKSLSSIDIVGFCPISDVPWTAYEKPYYIGPDRGDKKRANRGADKSYQLLMQTMKGLGEVTAIAKVAIREKESLCLIRELDGMLAIELLKWADEIRPASDEIKPLPVSLSDKELELGKQLAMSMVKPFNFSEHVDGYHKAFMELIEAKSKGEVITSSAAPVASVSDDLISSLMASVGIKA